ncbi:MAG: 50S ribosomal protein L30 [Rickettsiales bacterium]|nr:50S ribosomal protein L30 [Rickettsiales bacterium]
MIKKKTSPKEEKQPAAKDLSSKGKTAIGKKAKKSITAGFKVTQIKSAIGKQKYQKQTLIGLGLNKLNRSVLVEDTSAIRGMMNKVDHLIKIEKI